MIPRYSSSHCYLIPAYTCCLSHPHCREGKAEGVDANNHGRWRAGDWGDKTGVMGGTAEKRWMEERVVNWMGWDGRGGAKRQQRPSAHPSWTRHGPLMTDDACPVYTWNKRKSGKWQCLSHFWYSHGNLLKKLCFWAVGNQGNSWVLWGEKKKNP